MDHTREPQLPPEDPTPKRRPYSSDVDSSPHQDGRAQPGDVLGIETEGEETHLGETREDEDERREDAEDSARRS